MFLAFGGCKRVVNTTSRDFNFNFNFHRMIKGFTILLLLFFVQNTQNVLGSIRLY